MGLVLGVECVYGRVGSGSDRVKVSFQPPGGRNCARSVMKHFQECMKLHYYYLFKFCLLGEE